jgi:hypothetical protein
MYGRGDVQIQRTSIFSSVEWLFKMVPVFMTVIIFRVSKRVKVQIPECSNLDVKGKHDICAKQTPENVSVRVGEFIENLPSRSSHYSCSENKACKYVSSDLT